MNPLDQDRKEVIPSSPAMESHVGGITFVPPKTRRKVAIVGTAPNSIAAPFDDPSWEIWGVGFRGAHVTRATRWYEIHNLALEKDGKDWPPLFDKWAADCDVWMFFPDQLPNVKEKCRQYPVKFILDRHSPRFLSSSFAWMFAHALHAHELGEDKVDEIGVWGVDMEGGTEYEEQRAGCFHFIEIAKMLGVNVRLVTSGGLAYVPPPYPFSKDDPVAEKLKLKREALEAEKAKYDQMGADARQRMAYLQGQIEFIGTLRDKFVDADERIAKVAAARAIVEKANVLSQHALAEIKGWLECVKWMTAYFKG